MLRSRKCRSALSFPSLQQVRRRLLPPLLVCGAVLGLAGSAAADVSSWMYAGAGAAMLKGDRDSNRGTLQFDAGIGGPPGPVVLGAVFRFQPYLGKGTDLALLGRVATGGYVQGNFGLAFDIGAYQRFWGVGSTGGLASLSLGAPWGITLSGSAGLGTEEQRFGSLTLGIDFARLTVHRTTGTSWFANPYATDEQGRGPRGPSSTRP
ncbi:MAG TPA: hypothetical protein VFQ61_27545 [Polyangiaceae bacterium]|nr:hypothetical protein [Polyangiaceae bacterium]